MTGQASVAYEENRKVRDSVRSKDTPPTPSSTTIPSDALSTPFSPDWDPFSTGGLQERRSENGRWSIGGQPWQVDSHNNQRRTPPPQLQSVNASGISHSVNKSRKRTIENAQTLRTTAAEPKSKRPKLRSKPSKIPDFPTSTQPTRSEITAVSPLFFSHTPRQRPSLPRFSSSEAGAAIMKKATVEDGSTSARTVKLVRGLVTGTNSQRAASTPSGRYPAERQSTPRVLPSDEKERTAQSLKLLAQIGIIELLEQDDRLVFLVDLGNRLIFQPGPVQVVYANASLKGFPAIFDAIRGKAAENAIGLTSDGGFAEFKAWVTSFVQDGESMDISLPTFGFCGASWTCATLRKKFRVFYGTGLARASSVVSDLPATTQTLASSTGFVGNSHDYITDVAETVSTAPSDYFGSLFPQAKANHLEGGDSVLSSIETSNSTKEALLLNGTSRQNKSSLSPLAPDHPPWSIAHTPEEPSVKLTSRNTQITQSPSSFDWTQLSLTAALPKHIQFARSIDWASTSLGPIETWPATLRLTCNLLMASPHPAAMYWGEDNVALYNEPYILLAGKKHPKLMGQTYREAWGEIWEGVKDHFLAAKLKGQSTMKDDDCLFVNRSGFLEETYFSWSLIPLVGPDGSVAGLFNPAFEKTRRKIAERRMLTLREVGDETAAAREVKSFWPQVLKGLQYNEYDAPFVLLYSIGEDGESDTSSIHSNSILGAKSCVLEGTLPEIPAGHPIAPPTLDLRSGGDGFASVFREAMMADKPVLLQASDSTLDQSLLQGLSFRGFPENPTAAVVCPIHPTTGDSINGFLVMGINPRRPYDDDYSLFVQLLSRQLATSLASVALFEEEIRRGQRAAKLAALDRIELSEQLAARTLEAVESETKFTRMAELAPVGMFIADRQGRMIFTNNTFHAVSSFPKGLEGVSWMDAVKDEDRSGVQSMWDDLIHKKVPMAAEFRFKTPWENPNGSLGDTWVLGSAYPEQDSEGNLKSAFGSITNISQQKWAQDIQKKRVEEEVELKRQQSNFIDMTSHEMRNPLSAILQCADEISGSLLEFKASPGEYQIPISLLDSNIDAAQTIALCANHQTRIVSDVLTLSKLDSALLLVTPVDIRPAGIVQQTVKMFEGELHTADIKMEFKIDPSIEELRIDWVRLDPSRLLQVLINLTTNAIKFTTNQSKRAITITLSASSEPPSSLSSGFVSYIPSRSKKTDVTEGKDWGQGENVYLNFAVQDTGKGLSQDEKKLLFLRFSQASPKTHVQYGGSGLGLFISRELVELQGGEIGVSSESGKGSTFAFYVKARKSQGPVEASDHVSPAGSIRKSSMNRPPKQANTIRPSISNDQLSPTAASKPLEHYRILIVEDNLVNQRVLSKQLSNQGCIVSVANHGGECIEQLKQTKFWVDHETEGTELNLVLMDLEMPVMDGLTCTRTIRDFQKTGSVVRHIPIIAVSANARNAHVESALEAGMDDVVSKPFRIPELVPKIKSLVEKSSSGRSRT